MKIVVIGGSGLIGTKVVSNLNKAGHEVIAASPSNGVNTITGEGLAEVLQSTDVVIDLSNSPSFEDDAVMEFFQTSGRNLAAAERAAGVKHHVALSIVGVDGMQNIGYMRAKKAQEDLVRQSGIPYTIVRSTQFFEFMSGIADKATDADEVHLSDVLFQPIAADDVASIVTAHALAAPANDKVEIAGPERYEMHDIVGRHLQQQNDKRKVVPDGKPWYFGGEIETGALVPAGPAELGATRYEQWWASQLQTA